MLLSLPFIIAVASNSSWLTHINTHPTPYTVLQSNHGIFRAFRAHLSFFLFKRIGNAIKNKQTWNWIFWWSIALHYRENFLQGKKATDLWEKFLMKLGVWSAETLLVHMPHLTVREICNWILIFNEAFILSLLMICSQCPFLQRKNRYAQNIWKFKMKFTYKNDYNVMYYEYHREGISVTIWKKRTKEHANFWRNQINGATEIVNSS